jgi:hypothetical protein
MRRVTHSSRGVLPSVVCLSVIVKPRYKGGPSPLGAVAPWGGGAYESRVNIMKNINLLAPEFSFKS